jgi:hypothetical protein
MSAAIRPSASTIRNLSVSRSVTDRSRWLVIEEWIDDRELEVGADRMGVPQERRKLRVTGLVLKLRDDAAVDADDVGDERSGHAASFSDVLQIPYDAS